MNGRLSVLHVPGFIVYGLVLLIVVVLCAPLAWLAHRRIA